MLFKSEVLKLQFTVPDLIPAPLLKHNYPISFDAHSTCLQNYSRLLYRMLIEHILDHWKPDISYLRLPVTDFE